MRISTVQRFVFLTYAFCFGVPACASEPVLVQAQRYVEQQLDTQLQGAALAQIQRDVQVMSPRGAALQPCPGGWQWEPVNLRHWARIHVGVKCSGEAGSMVAVVHAQGPVWVATRPLPQGHRLQEQDLQQQIQTIQSAEEINSGWIWLGRTVRKPLKAGSAVLARHLTAPTYARKGEKVEIRATVEGVTVSVMGIASRTAQEGEMVRVRNLSSQQWVTGRLIAPGVLEPTEQPTGGVKVQLSD